jgi:hypothetical protein
MPTLEAVPFDFTEDRYDYSFWIAWAKAEEAKK